MKKIANHQATYFISSSNKLKIIFPLLLMLSFVFNASQALADTESDAIYEQALISFQNDEINTAIIHLKNVLSLEKNHMPARLLLAQAHIEQGNGIGAEVELDKARIGNVDRDRLVTLYGQAYLLQNRYDDALSVTKPGNRGNKVESELLLISGQAYIGKKQFASADKAFESALLITPNNQIALLGRSQLALRDGKAAKALQYIEQALKSARPFVNGWVLKANILQKLQQSDAAMAAIDKALEIDNSHFAARLAKAMLLIEQKEFELARSHVDYILDEIPNEPRAGYLNAIINASVEKDTAESSKKLTEVITTLASVPADVMRTTPDYYYLAGITNFQFGNAIDARRYLTSYLNYVEFDINSVRMIATIDLQHGDTQLARNLLTKTNLAKPDNPSILTLLGLTYLQLQDNKRAQFYFEKVLTKYPTSEIGITNLARSQMQSGDYQTAIDALTAIKDNNINGAQIKLLLIDSYQRSNAIKKAIEVALELTEQFPSNSYFQQKLGMLYGLNGELEQAKKSFESALSLDENNVWAIIHLARMDNIAGQSDKALSRLQFELEKSPQNTLLMTEISDTYLIKSDNENALLWSKKAYSQAPNNLNVIVKLAHILVAKEQVNEAIEIVDIFIGQNKKQTEALILIASLYQKVNKHRQAVLALRDYVSSATNKTKAYIYLAKAQLKANERVGAIQSYRKAILADETSVSAHLGLVNLVIENKDKKFALTLISTIGTLTNSKSLQETLTGDLYLKLGDAKQAKQHYLAALSLSDQKQALLGLYRSYKLENSIAEVIPHLQKWLTKHPDDMLVEISLADSYKNSGQLNKAATYYEKLISKHGQLPILLNNAASVYFAIDDTKKAKEYAQLAYEYVSDNVAIIDTLAWIEARMGNHEVALGLFRKALTKDFDNAEIKYHLAVSLYALERKVEAKKQLIESVESKQIFPEKQQATELLNTWL